MCDLKQKAWVFGDFHMYFCFYECGEERHSANAFYGQGVGLTKRSIFTFIPYVVRLQR